VSQCILLGSGWHPPLFRSEISSLFGEIEVLHPRIVLLDQIIDDIFLSRVSRAALVDDILHYGGYSLDSDFEQLVDKITNWCEVNLPSGSFAVRSRKLGTGVEKISRRDLEKEIGARLFSKINPVNLHDPDFEIVIIVAGKVEGEVHRDSLEFEPSVVWGIRENNWEKSNFLGRQPMERPFFKPISLEPRLAKLLISLAHRKGKTPKKFIDPFCGTGGIAIEAYLQGMDVLVSDLDPTMVYGIKKNLQWANNHGNNSVKIEKCSVKDISELWGPHESAIFVFDPPYGRNAWKSDDGLELFFSALEQARKIDPNSVVSTMLPAGSESLQNNPDIDYVVMGRPWSEIEHEINRIGWKVNLRLPVKVHKSLSRMVVVCHPLH
tara:strand:+ start:2287 stop:3423 length:1137 start_codon:yes stop_codon:yes gene_type:complete